MKKRLIRFLTTMLALSVVLCVIYTGSDGAVRSALSAEAAGLPLTYDAGEADGYYAAELSGLRDVLNGTESSSSTGSGSTGGSPSVSPLLIAAVVALVVIVVVIVVVVLVMRKKGKTRDTNGTQPPQTGYQPPQQVPGTEQFGAGFQPPVTGQGYTYYPGQNAGGASVGYQPPVNVQPAASNAAPVTEAFVQPASTPTPAPVPTPAPTPVQTVPAPVTEQAPQAAAPEAEAVNEGEAETEVLNAGADETTVLAGGPSLPAAYLLRIRNHQKVNITKQVFKIGKERRKVDFCIVDNNSISRTHADILYQDNTFFIVDNHSTNGTIVNGVLLTPEQPAHLMDGDTIRMADEDFTFRLEQR